VCCACVSTCFNLLAWLVGCLFACCRTPFSIFFQTRREKKKFQKEAGIKYFDTKGSMRKVFSSVKQVVLKSVFEAGLPRNITDAVKPPMDVLFSEYQSRLITQFNFVDTTAMRARIRMDTTQTLKNMRYNSQNRLKRQSSNKKYREETKKVYALYRSYVLYYVCLLFRRS